MWGDEDVPLLTEKVKSAGKVSFQHCSIESERRDIVAITNEHTDIKCRKKYLTFMGILLCFIFEDC